MQQKNTQGLRPLEKKSLALALESESVFYRCQTRFMTCSLVQDAVFSTRTHPITFSVTTTGNKTIVDDLEVL